MASRQALAPKLYKRFLQVCEQWPVDQNRLGRDLGEHLKGNLVPRIKNSQIDPKEAEKMLDSLLKISSNHYRNKYPRQKETAFTTNNVQDCKEAASYYLSSDFQKKSKQQSWWERLIRKKPTAS